MAQVVDSATATRPARHGGLLGRVRWPADKLFCMTLVRRADQSDLEQLLAVDPLAAVGDAGRRASLRRAVDQDICFIGADDQGARGFVVMRPRHFYGRDFIDLLIVVPEHRRQGLGRELMRTAIAAAGTSTVFTSTNESNAPMRALLEAEGWSLSGKLDGLDEGDPELVYYLRR